MSGGQEKRASGCVCGGSWADEWGAGLAVQEIQRGSGRRCEGHGGMGERCGEESGRRGEGRGGLSRGPRVRG